MKRTMIWLFAVVEERESVPPSEPTRVIDTDGAALDETTTVRAKPALAKAGERLAEVIPMRRRTA